MMNAEAKEPAEAPVRFGARAANITGSVTGLESQGSQRNGSASESRAEEDPEHGGKVRREPADESRGPRWLRAREGEARTGELRQREPEANNEAGAAQEPWQRIARRCARTSAAKPRLCEAGERELKHGWALLIAGRAQRGISSQVESRNAIWKARRRSNAVQKLKRRGRVKSE